MGNKPFYLENNFKTKCKKDYDDYMHTIIKIFNENGISEIFSKLEECFTSDRERTIKFLENANLSIKTLYKNPKYNFQATQKKKSLQSYNSALSGYISFLKDWKVEKTTVKKTKEVWSETCIEEETLVYSLAHHINGNDSLLQILKNKNLFEFVKVVLGASYFFDPDDVKKRFTYLCDAYEKNNKMDARWTESYLRKYPNYTKKDIIAVSNEEKKNEIKYTINGLNYSKDVLVKIDKDGNKAVRDLIKSKTGHKVSQGIGSTFHFYKISHIWGNAFDPRYFTNLWNIVLVPAWANDLLDKTNSRDPLTVAFQQIVKNVCIKHYNMESLKWNLIDMNCPEFSKDYIDSLKNNQENNNELKIQINVFCQKDQEEFAKIRRKTITI